MRLCIVNIGEEIFVNKRTNGSFEITSVSQGKKAKIDHFLQIVTDASDIIFRSNVKSCVQTMEINMSDITSANLNFRDSGVTYDVTVPWNPTSIYIASGYNVTQYELDLAKKNGSFLGVLINIYAFEFPVHLVVAFLILSLASLWISSSLVNRRMPSFRQKVEKKMKSKNFWHTCPTRKFVFFFKSLSIFLLATPFRCIYKTTQVVVSKPPLITNYEDLMKANSSLLYANVNVDLKSLLKPTPQNIEKQDVIYRIHEYVSKFEWTREIKGARKIIYLLKQQRHLTFSGKAVLIGDEEIVEKGLTVACLMTFQNELHRYYKFRDPNQREELTGFGTRHGLKNQKLTRRLRWMFEMNSIVMRRTRLARYLYTNYVYTDPGVSEEQVLAQRHLCLDIRTADRTREVFTNDILFFLCSFLLATTLFIIASVFLIIEKVLFYRHSKFHNSNLLSVIIP